MELGLKPGKDFIGVGVFALIQDEEGRVVLTKAKASEKKGRDYENIWSMPGGTLEFGETCEMGLRREIKEELGIEISDIELLNYDDYLQEGKHWLALNFAARTREEARNLETEKNEEVDSFAIAQVPQEISPYTRACLESIRTH